jgi:tetratricopeptide (TPR) repeat protein
MGDYESALAANYRALDLDPDLLPVVMNVGTALLADGQTEAAMEQYERGLAMVADPDASIPASWSHLYLRLTVVDLDTLIAALDGWTGFADEPDLSYVEDPAALRAAAEAARLRIKEGLVAIEAAGVFQMEPTGATLPSIAFARDVGLDGVLVGQGDTFARGTLAVVATLSYEDLPQGAVVSRRVMRQWADDPGAVENLPTMGADIPWNAGSEGAVQHVLWAPWPGDRGLRPGKYIVEYYVNGHLLQAGSFAIPDEDTLIFSPIVFATEYTSGGIPSDPADIFPAGVAEVYALINYSGVPEGNIAHAEWYRDGEYYYGQQTSAISGWGNHSFSISDVPAGTYRFDLSIEGQGEVLQSASFEVLAVGDYLQAIGGEPDNSLFYRNLGDAYAYASDYQAAGDSYEQAVELDSQCGKCYYRWWSVLYDQARYEEAIGKLERAIELRPKEYTYVSDLGRTYYLLGDDEKAAAAYREAVPANPASVYNRWGNAFFDLERYEEAAMKYQQSLELAPDDAVVHANLGGAYQELGEYDEAVAEFQEAVTVDPEYAWAYNRWGNVLYDQERYTEAAKKYLEAIAVAPADSLYHSNLGWAYFKLGWYEEAGAAFERAVELNPSASDCNMWGRALFELGQYLEAAEKHLWAIDLNPEEPLYHYNLGWDLYQLGETEEAIAAFEQAADLAAMQGDEDTLQDAEEALEGLR